MRRGRMRGGFAWVAVVVGGSGLAQGQLDPVEPAPPAPLNSDSFTDTVYDKRPAIASAPAGVSVAVWDIGASANGPFAIVASTTLDSGQTWSPQTVIYGAPGFPRQSTPAIATDGEGVWVVMWASRTANIPGVGNVGNDDDIWFSRSTDNGATWSPAAPLNFPYAVATPGASVDQKPSVVALGDGEWVAAWETNAVISADPVFGSLGNDFDIVVSRSVDDGASWSYPAPLRAGYAFGGTAGSNDDNDVKLATDSQGRVVAVWSSVDDLARFNEVNIGNDRDILVARSASRGISWSFPEPLNDFAVADNSPARNDTVPTISADAGGTWIVAWQSSYPGDANQYGADFDIWMSKSVKLGELWSPAVPLGAAFASLSANNTAPTLRTDGLGNWIAVWVSVNALGINGLPSIGGDEDILYAFSNDAGESWAFPGVMNTNAASDGSARDLSPALSVDGSGVWIVAWETEGALFGASTSETDLASTRFESPIVDVAWTGVASGIFGVSSNWNPQRVPTIFDRAAFDQTLVANTLPGVYSVTVNAPTVTGRMAARTNFVTLLLLNDYHLAATASDIAPTPLIVGEYDEGDARLRVTNPQAGLIDDRAFTTESAAIAIAPGSVGALDIAGVAGAATPGVNFLVTRGPTLVGERGTGDLSVLSGATADLTGDIIIGVEPGADGIMQVRGSGTRVQYGGVSDDPASLIVGDAGEGDLVVGLAADAGPGPALEQTEAVADVIVGNLTGALGRVRVEGAGTTWNSSASRLILGNHGAAEVAISAGGTLVSTSSEVSVAKETGSSALVEIRDAGSQWLETTQSVNIGLGGQAVVTVGPGATLKSLAGVNLLSNGRLVGAGTIEGEFVNTGDLRVGVAAPGATAPDGFGVLQVVGRYLQLGPPASGQPRSGSLSLRLGGTQRGVTHDAIDVANDAFLGGGLFVTLTPSYAMSGGPALGQTFNLLQSSQLDANNRTFDVALLPGFADERLMKVNYLNGNVQLEVTQFGRGLGFTPPQGGLSVEGTPSWAVVANLDRDPQNLPDLAVTVVGSPSFLYVFRNGGNDPQNGQWLGFSEVYILTLSDDDGEPTAVGVGDFNQNGFADDLVIAFDRVGSGRVRFFQNTGVPAALYSPIPQAYAVADDPTGLAVGDITGNFLDDVVVVTGEGRTLERLFAQPAMVHAIQAPRSLLGPARPSSVDISDLDNDKDLLLGGAERDVVIGDAGTNAFLVLRNNGSGDFTDPPIVLDAEGALDQIVLADVNDDGLIDIVGLVPGRGEVAVVINRPTPGEFAPAVNIAIGDNPSSLVVADLGGSEALDIAVITDAGAPGSREVRTLRGEVIDNAVAYSPGPSFEVQAGAEILRAADLTNSDVNDLVTLGGPAPGEGEGDPLGRVEAHLNAQDTPCEGDTNGDGVINFADLNAVLSSFGQTGAGLPGDVNADGAVNFADLNIILSRFGEVCDP